MEKKMRDVKIVEKNDVTKLNSQKKIEVKILENGDKTRTKMKKTILEKK